VWRPMWAGFRRTQCAMNTGVTATCESTWRVTPPPLALAKEIEEHLLVALAGQDAETIASAIVLLRQLIARLEELPGA